MVTQSAPCGAVASAVGVEGQGHPQRPHLVCQEVFQPTVHYPLSICSPSATTVCPVTRPSFHSEPYCVPLSHTLLPSLTHSFTAQCIRQEHASFAGCLMKVEMETKGPTCPCLQFNTKRKMSHSHMHIHRREHWSSLLHCYEQSCVCKSNRGCTEWAAPLSVKLHACK